MKRFFLFAAACLICPLLWGQTAETSLLEELTELTAENSEDELNLEELTETWEYFLENPININDDCTEELRQLKFLTEFQIQSLVGYKDRNSPVLSIYELAAVEGFDRELLLKLKPFLSFEESKTVSTTRRKAHREMLFRTQRIAETAKGYSEENGYLGAPEKYYLRFKQTGDRLNFGFTTEKDPGETFFRNPNKNGFDYYSLFANYGFKNGKYRIYAGDFLVRSGQGLLVWQGFASGKSSEATQIYRSNQEIRSYSSADETGFSGASPENSGSKIQPCSFFILKRKSMPTLRNTMGKPFLLRSRHRDFTALRMKPTTNIQ